MLVAVPPHYPFLPISLNSIDREGVRLLSPHDSQITSKTSCRCRWYRAGDATELKEEFDEDLVHHVVSFQLISGGAQSGWSGIFCIRGCLSLFGSVVGPWLYLDDIWFIYVLCEVAIVSQLCISFPYVLHGLCEDYLTCDIAFNAVMPLSRASTRRRYSRIEGITSW